MYDMIAVAEEELEREHQHLQDKDLEVQQYKARLFATRDIFFLRSEHVFRLVLARNLLLDFMAQWEGACCAAYACGMHWARLAGILRERFKQKLQRTAFVESWRRRGAADILYVPVGVGRSDQVPVPDRVQSVGVVQKREQQHDKTPAGKAMKENLEWNR